MRAVDAVISEPTHVPVMRRGLFGVITLVAWTAFVWLLAPAVTLVLWVVGGRTALDTTFGRIGTVDPVLASVVFILSAVAAAALILWAEVQRRRFTGVERRKRAEDATAEEIAAELGCDEQTAQVLRSSKVVSLRMRADGSPEAATPIPVRIPRPRRPVDESRPVDEGRPVDESRPVDKPVGTPDRDTAADTVPSEASRAG